MSVRFFYDVGSPYAYLTGEVIDERMPEPVEWVPVLLGAIFKVTGRSSWAETERRDDGIAEIERRAAERGLPPLGWPDSWPNDGLLAMRVAAAAHAHGKGREYAQEAMRVHFRDGLALSEPTAIETAVTRAGLDPALILAEAASAPVKLSLRESTERALALGVIGVPSIAVGSEVFWGDDRLEDAIALAQELGGR